MAANHNWQTLSGKARGGINSRRINRNAQRSQLKHVAFQENRFLPLRYVKEPDSMPSSQNGSPDIPKTSRPPPIVIDIKHNFRSIQQNLQSEKLKFKQMRTGTKIFTQNMEEYNELLSKLKEQNTEFYTHRTKDDREFKVFLYGLPKIATDDILRDLKSRNLEPSEVKEIKTKYSNDDNAAYTVVFKKSSVTLRELKKVKFICRTEIQWKQYRRENKDHPTLCWKCLMYGHGGQNCYRSKACMICANTDHLSKDCPFDKEATAVKCFNCIKNKKPAAHRANDPKCPSRAEYLNIRANSQLRNTRQRQPQFSLDENSFPLLSRDYKEVQSNPSFSTRNKPTYSDVITGGDDLFSIEELFDIFQNAVQQLNRCNSKREQIGVIVSLLQYAT